MNIKMICFDLDDTLHDHLKPFTLAFQTCFSNVAASMNMEDVYKAFRAHSDELWEDYIQGSLSLQRLQGLRIQLGLQDYEIFITAEEAFFFQKRYEEAAKHITFFDEVPSLFNILHTRGIEMGLITNGAVLNQQRKIDRLGIENFIPKELIFISDGVGFTKPDPCLFQHVLNKTNYQPEEMIYVGDTWHADIEGAYHAGWHPVWFNHRHRKRGSEIKPLLEIDQLSQILEIL